MMSRDSISVVILSHRRPGPLTEALRSIVEQELPPEEIIVVDNKSDESERLKEIVLSFPRTQWIANDQNLGFSRAVNRASELATGRFIYVGVDDLLLHRKCLGEMAGYLMGQSRPLIVTGTLLRGHSDVIQCAGGRLSLRSRFHLEFIGTGTTALAEGKFPFDVTYVPGGMVMAERSVFQRLGGYRSEFFMYHEDTEMSVRARRLGCALAVVPSAIAYDLVASNPGPTRRVEVSKITNLFSMYLLHADWAVLARFLTRYTIFYPMKAVFSAPRHALDWVVGLVKVVPRIGVLMKDRRAIAAFADQWNRPGTNAAWFDLTQRSRLTGLPQAPSPGGEPIASRSDEKIPKRR